jgi:homoserine kinase
VSGHVVVRVPASTSNLGAGFDCVGVAVDRWLTIVAWIDEGTAAPVVVERGGTLAGLAVPPEDDLLTAGFRAACYAMGRPIPSALHIRAHSDIPIARGLGSSGAAVVAGAAAANALLELGLDDRALLGVATEREGHPDNAAAAICGGAVLVLDARERGPGVIATELPLHPDLALVVAVPDFAVETKHARSILPRRVAHEVATLAVARAAALVHGLSTSNATLLSQALDDVLHVPFRRILVAGYDAVVEAAREAGAFGATLSGSGSSIVAVVPRARADAVGAAMAAEWAAHGVTAAHFTNASRVAGYSATLDAPIPPELTPQLAGAPT